MSGKEGWLWALTASAAMLFGHPLCSSCKRESEAPPPAPRVDGPDAAVATMLEDTVPPRATRAVIDRIVVRVLESRPAVEIDESSVARRLGFDLAESGEFVALARDLPAGTVPRHGEIVLTVQWYPAPPGMKKALLISVVAELGWLAKEDGEPPLVESLLAEIPVDEGEEFSETAVIARVRAAISGIAPGLIGREKLRRVGDDELARAVSGKDLSLARWALELVASRKVTAATAAVLERLRSDAVELHEPATRAAMALKSEEAVPLLTARVNFSAHQDLIRVVDAVGVIGGDEAEEFLEFVSTGHPDSEVKEHAAAALSRLHQGGRSP